MCSNLKQQTVVGGGGCCVLGYNCWDETSWPKASWGGKSLFGLHIQVTVLWEKPKQGLVLKLWKIAVYWTVPRGLLSLLSSRNLRQGWHYTQRAGPASINHQLRKWPTDLLTTWSYRHIFSIEAPSSLMTFSFCQVDIKLANTGCSLSGS